MLYVVVGEFAAEHCALTHGYGPGFDQDEVIWGTEAIGKAINLDREQARYLLSNGHLPGTKIGRRWVAARSALYQAVGLKIVTVPASAS